MFKFSIVASFLILFSFHTVTTFAQVASPVVTTLTASVPDSTGNTKITFACSGANYSHLWLDGKDLDQGYYSSKVVSTGALTPGVDHSVLAYCWNPAGAGASKTIFISCGVGKNLVNGTCVYIPPTVTTLSSKVLDTTGNTQITYACSNANYSHLYLDGKDLDQGYYASKVVNTGALTPGVDHNVLAYCWNPAGASASKTIAVSCGVGKQLVSDTCIFIPPTVTNLSSKVLDATGNTQITFSCTNGNYSHLWLDGKDLDQGYYSSKVISTGALTPWVDHSVLAYCWNPAGAADAKTIVIPGCYKYETLNASGVCEKNRVAKHDSATLVNWTFNVPDINTLEYKVVVDSDPGKRANMYLQLYDTSIDGNGQYFGLQTNGKALFSRHGSADVSSADVPTGSTVVTDNNPLTNGEGFSFVSLWRDLGIGGSLIAGTYTVKVARDNYDGVGDWFRFYVTPPNGIAQYVGGLRFPRANATIPASFKDGAATWIEPWDNNAPDIVSGASLAYQLADLSIHVSPKVNGSILYDGAIGHYTTSTPAFQDAGNADMYQESPSTIRMIMGHSSVRVHQNTAFKCPTGSKLVNSTCVYGPPVVTTLSSKVLDATGNTQITFSCTNGNYSHLWLDGKDLDQGYYASKVVNTGALALGSTHSVQAYCWNKDSSSADSKTINFTATLALVPSIKTISSAMVLGDYTTALSCVDISRNIHRGIDSASVTNLQSFLIGKGLLEGASTGFFGDKTVQAVKDYQISRGLPATGMVYDFTRYAIKEETCK